MRRLSLFVALLTGIACLWLAWQCDRLTAAVVRMGNDDSHNNNLHVEKTYGMIKPDAVAAGHADDIMHDIAANGFTIIAHKKLQMTKERAEEFYAEHHGKEFYDALTNFMSSGPVVAMVLAKDNAIKDWRALAGPTNSIVAREQAPQSIRARFGTDGQKNAVHGSDSAVSAQREIRFFFPHLLQDPLPTGPQTQDYITRVLQPTLTKALTALCKAKPSSNGLEATSWLAQWLLDNNPKAPRVESTEEEVAEVKPPTPVAVS